VISLGGQGISISAYTKNREAALAFLQWLESRETQLEWVKLGGASARRSVLGSDTFLSATPYNRYFPESFELVKDFWNLPEYASMLAIEQEYLSLAVTGQMSAKQALDTIAQKQQEILDQTYRTHPKSKNR
jgi:multiple sugar transport system substrate-binding protein